MAEAAQWPMHCHRQTVFLVVVVLSGAIDYFERGLNVAEAFPDLPKPEREFLISGTSA